jgi:RNA polymerase sigma factor (sigma-70 family)
MERAATETAIRHLRAALEVSEPGGATDAELLDRFVRSRDEAAFELLVWRHRRLTLSVCRRVLRHEQDAEDAFQATFLILARKAGTIGRRESLSGWLHTVATRVATAARAVAAHRTARERPGVDMSAVSDPVPDPADTMPADVLAALDQEISRLPRKYREPLLLCYLEGLTYRQAGDRLSVPVGTLSARLAKARAWLQNRLTRRGIVCSASVLTLLAQESALGNHSVLIRTTARAAVAVGTSHSSGPYAHPHYLAGKVTRAMFVKKLNTVCVAFLTVSVILGAVFSLSPGRTEDKKDPPKPVAKPADEKSVPLRGTWARTVIDEIIVGGKPLPPKERTQTVVITGDRIRLLDDEGFINEEMVFTLDPNGKAGTINLTDPRFGTFQGICKLDGNRLRIAYNSSIGGTRPAELPTDEAACPPGICYWDLKRVSPDPKVAVQRFQNAPGCFWMWTPASPSSSFATLGLVLLFEKDADGAAVLTLAAAAAIGVPSEIPEYRPVIFDAEKRRFLPVILTGGASGGSRDRAVVTLRRWRMDPKVLSADKVAFVGVEQLTTETQQIAAHEAVERARKKGIEVFPYRKVGKTYEFAVKTTDGKTISSKDLLGKVVVIDWWATWCSPCMKLLPEIKDLYEKRRGDGLEVVGVNLDSDPEVAKKTCRELGITWPQVFIPADEAIRELWLKAVGTESIPLILVIDRKGVLRAVKPTDLKRELETLLNEAK